MSKYREIKTEFRNADSLIKALQELNIPFDVAADPHKPELPLFDWHRIKRPQAASIAIRKDFIDHHWSNTGSWMGASNDIGFAWNGQQFTAIVSDYDQGREGVIQGLGKVTQRYAVIESRRLALRRGLTIQEEQLSDGSIRLVCKRR